MVVQHKKREPQSQTTRVKRVPSLCRHWNEIVFMWELRSCSLNLLIVLWGHGYYTLKPSRGTGKMMPVFSPVLVPWESFLLPGSLSHYFISLLCPAPPPAQLISHSTNPCTFQLMSEFFADFGKTTLYICLKCVRILILCSRVLIKNKHYQVRFLSTKIWDNGKAMTHLFHHLLSDLSCQVCKTQESTYCFKILHQLEVSLLFFSLLLNWTMCLSQKISRISWNYSWNSKFVQLIVGAYEVASF